MCRVAALLSALRRAKGHRAQPQVCVESALSAQQARARAFGARRAGTSIGSLPDARRWRLTASAACVSATCRCWATAASAQHCDCAMLGQQCGGALRIFVQYAAHVAGPLVRHQPCRIRRHHLCAQLHTSHRFSASPHSFAAGLGRRELSIATCDACGQYRRPAPCLPLDNARRVRAVLSLWCGSPVPLHPLPASTAAWDSGCSLELGLPLTCAWRERLPSLC